MIRFLPVKNPRTASKKNSDVDVRSPLFQYPHIAIFTLEKTELTPIEKTPNPGILRALIFVSLQNGLRLSENDPMFDRKLLDYLHEQGVRNTSNKIRIRVVILCWEMIYSEPYTASDCHFSNPVFGFFGIGVPR